MNFINILDQETIYEEIRRYGFDLKKDIKETLLNENGFLKIFADFIDDFESGLYGDLLYSREDRKVYSRKIRFKDEKRKIGKRSGYRIIYIVKDSYVFIIHIYHKTAGKNSKKDLTEKEKKNLKKLVDEL